jgi:hypothetical protein
VPDWQAPPGEQLPQFTVWPQLLAGLLPQLRLPHCGVVHTTQDPLLQFSLDWQVPQVMVWPQLLAGLLPQVREPQLGGVQATHVPLVQVSLDWHEPQLMV